MVYNSGYWKNLQYCINFNCKLNITHLNAPTRPRRTRNENNPPTILQQIEKHIQNLILKNWKTIVTEKIRTVKQIRKTKKYNVSPPKGVAKTILKIRKIQKKQINTQCKSTDLKRRKQARTSKLFTSLATPNFRSHAARIDKTKTNATKTFFHQNF